MSLPPRLKSAILKSLHEGDEVEVIFRGVAVNPGFTSSFGQFGIDIPGTPVTLCPSVLEAVSSVRITKRNQELQDGVAYRLPHGDVVFRAAGLWYNKLGLLPRFDPYCWSSITPLYDLEPQTGNVPDGYITSFPTIK